MQVNVGGTWHDTNPYVKVAGVWRHGRVFNKSTYGGCVVKDNIPRFVTNVTVPGGGADVRFTVPSHGLQDGNTVVFVNVSTTVNGTRSIYRIDNNTIAVSGITTTTWTTYSGWDTSITVASKGWASCTLTIDGVTIPKIHNRANADSNDTYYRHWVKNVKVGSTVSITVSEGPISQYNGQTNLHPSGVAPYKYGDCDGDGFCTLYDAIMIQQRAIGITDTDYPGEDSGVINADINNDGIVNGSDSVMALQCAVGTVGPGLTTRVASGPGTWTFQATGGAIAFSCPSAH